jgi:flagellar biosynthesis protein
MKEGKIASAIAYSSGDIAPRLLAAGRNKAAERIIELAKAAGVTVIEDPALAILLDSGIKAGDIIPVWCWEAAARILAFVLKEEGHEKSCG